jgi:hypothetical protein
MVAGRTRNRIELPGPRDGRIELRHDVVLVVDLVVVAVPAEVIGLRDVFVVALKEGSILNGPCVVLLGRNADHGGTVVVRRDGHVQDQRFEVLWLQNVERRRRHSRIDGMKGEEQGRAKVHTDQHPDGYRWKH